MKKTYKRSKETIDRETKELFNYKQLINAYTNHIANQIDASNGMYHPYLVTVRFHNIPLSSSDMKQRYYFFTGSTWNQYSKTYRFMISNLTNNFSKKSHLYPRTYDFFDVPGTRNNINVEFTEKTIPHIHSIYLVHQETLGKFDALRNTTFNRVVNHYSMCDYVQNIHARPITSNLYETVAYCSKFYDNCFARAIRHDHCLYNQLPISKDEKKALAFDRLSMPFTVIKNMQHATNEDMRQRFRHLNGV